MSYYIVNFTDPLTPPVNISPMQLDGPGSLQSANTTLRLHGAGYLGWGEAVNENFVRMLENFMGASAPLDPVAGQLWVNVQLYHLNTLTSTFYRFDIDPSSVSYKTWVALTVVSQATAPTGTLGAYWFNTTDDTLNLFTSAYDRTPAVWMNRTYSSGAGVPTHTPSQFVKVFDANLGPVGTWRDVGGVSAFVSDSVAAPTGNEIGTLRYAPTTNMFYIWTGTGWESLTTGWGVGANVTDSVAPPLGNVIGSVRYAPTTQMFYVWTGTTWESISSGWGVGAYESDSTAPPVGDVVGSLRYAPAVDMFYIWTGTEWESLTTGWGVGASVSDSITAPIGDIVGSLRYSPTANMFYVWNGSTWESLTSGWGVGAFVSDSVAAPTGDIIGSLRWSPAHNMFYIWTGDAWESLTTSWGVGAKVSDSTAAPAVNIVGSLRYSPTDNLFYMWSGTAWQQIDTSGTGTALGKVYTIKSTTGFWYNGSINVNAAKWNNPTPPDYYNAAVDITSMTYRNHPLYNASKWHTIYRYSTTICIRSVFEWNAPTPTRVLIEAKGNQNFNSSYQVTGASYMKIEKFVGGVWVHAANADDGSWHSVTNSSGSPTGYLTVNADSVYVNKYEKNYALIFPGGEDVTAYNTDGTVFAAAWRAAFPPFEANVLHRITIESYPVTATSAGAAGMTSCGGGATFTLIGE